MTIVYRLAFEISITVQQLTFLTHPVYHRLVSLSALGVVTLFL